MKKLFVIFLVSLFLFSCSVSQLTDAMGKMGQNVMGDYVNTEAVDEVKNSATTVTPQKINPEGGNPEIPIIKDNKGNSIKVDLGDSTVTSILPGLSDEVKNNIIEATSSDGGAKNLAETLKNTSIDKEETIIAAKGTAKVLSAVLGKIIDPETEGTLSEESYKDAKDAIDTLKENLITIASDDSKVTASDVIALQAVTSLVSQITSYVNTDATTGEITSVEISESKKTDLVANALETVTVIQAINPASIISSDELETLIKALVKSEDSSRSFDIELKYADAIRNVYSIYKTLFGEEGINKSKVSVMSLYSGAFDIYAGLSDSENLSGQVADIDRIVQYALSTLFAQAEYEYSKVASEVFKGNYPQTLVELIKLTVANNEWIENSDITATQFDDSFVEFNDDCDFKDLAYKILPSMVSSGNTIVKLADKIDLTSFGLETKKIRNLPIYLADPKDDFDWNQEVK